MRRIELTPALWDEVAAADASATPFHTRGWAESAVDSFENSRDRTCAYVLDDGAIAVLPLLARGYGPFGELQCAPDSTFGGPIAQRPLSDADVAAIIAEVRVPRRWRFPVHGNPYADWRFRGAPSGVRTGFTQTVELRTDVSPLVSMRSVARTNVHKAERSGLDVYEGATDADLDAYMRCYEETLARWGTRTLYRVSRARFVAIRQRMGEAFRLWLVRFEGRVIGGACTLYHNKRVFYWHGATGSEGLQLNAARFVQSRIMDDAWRHGCIAVDLGTSSGIKGLEQFKASLGAVPKPFEHIVAVDSASFRLAHGIRSTMRRKLGR